MNSGTFRAPDGQVLVIVALSLLVFTGIAALAFDIGYVMHAKIELQASTDAAATAGARDLPNSTAVATAISYSGVSGNKNAYNDLPGVTMVSGYPQTKCLSYLTGLGLTCTNGAGANALAVQQHVSVPTFFAKVLGISSVTLNASALASMRYGTRLPANVIFIMDTTASMGNSDSDSSCKTGTGISSPTKLDCAKWGVRTLLKTLVPCAPNLSSCGSVTNGNVANPLDQVGLVTFPGLTSSSNAKYGYQTCGSNYTSSIIAPYTTPSTKPPYFTIVPLSSDYRTSASSGLNGSASNLVQAVDWTDGVGCTKTQYGLQTPGGVSTYYAGVITEAQADLSALTAPRSSMQNVIILLSDGDAEANCNAKNGFCQQGNFTSTTPQSYGVNECHQAITAAQTAAATQNAAGLKTWVYSIAFGASTSSTGSCSTDTTHISGCSTMSQIASDASKFYSDKANGCASTANPSITSLDQIFQNIGNDFSSTRLLPWNTQ